MMKKWLTLSAVLAAGGLLLLRPQEAAQAVREGLALCAGTVIPSQIGRASCRERVF